jgi:hypothetical protein
MPDPMPGRLDRALKVVWLTLGVLLLAGIVVAGVSVLLSFVQSGGEPGDGASPRPKAAMARAGAPALRYDAPISVHGTDRRLVLLRRSVEGAANGVSSAAPSRSVVNALFLAPDGTASLLLGRPAFVRAVDVPGAAGADSAARWITYEIAFDDTDRDGQLGPGDRAGLYVSALDGSGFRPVLPPGVLPRAHAALDATHLLVLALLPPADPLTPERRWPERAFVYDAAAGTLRPLAGLDSLVERAAGLLAR